MTAQQMKLDVSFTKKLIESMILSYPEMQDDEILRHDMVEGETDAVKILSKLVRSANETAAETEGLKTYIKELQSRQARFERREDAIRMMALCILNAANLASFRLPEATLSVRAGVPKVIITDEAALPDTYLRTKTEPNKSGIKSALESGKTVPGAVLSNAEPALTIRNT